MKVLIYFLLLGNIGLAEEKSTVLFLGDSLTAGYGLASEKSYPQIIYKKLKKNHNIEVLNGSVSGSTTASGLSRLKWFEQKRPDILFIALGANDGLRGVNPKTTYKNLSQIVDYAQKKKMKVILAGMMMPPNYGKGFTDEFKEVFSRVAKEKKVIFMPFLLKDVAAKEELNQPDKIHPNEKGQKIMADNVLPYIEAAL